MSSSNLPSSNTTTTTSTWSATLLVPPSSSSPLSSVSQPTHQDLVLQLDEDSMQKIVVGVNTIAILMWVRTSRCLRHQPPLLVAMQVSMEICTSPTCRLPRALLAPCASVGGAWWGEGPRKETNPKEKLKTTQKKDQKTTEATVQLLSPFSLSLSSSLPHSEVA